MALALAHDSPHIVANPAVELRREMTEKLGRRRAGEASGQYPGDRRFAQTRITIEPKAEEAGQGMEEFAAPLELGPAG